MCVHQDVVLTKRLSAVTVRVRTSRRGIDRTTVRGNSPCAYIKANPTDNVVAVEWGTSIASLSASRIVGVVTKGDVYGIDNTYVVTQGDVYGIDNTYVATAALLQHLETDIIPRVLKKSKASDLFAFLNRESGQSLVYDNTISMAHDTLVRLLESGQSLVYDNTISMGHVTLVRLLESGQSLVYDNTISMGHDTLVRLLESGQSLVYDITISMRHDTLVRLLESGQSLVYDNTISMGHDTLVRLLESGQSLVYDNTISMGHDTLVRLLVGSSTATARESDTALAYYVIDVRVILHWPTTS